MTGALLLLGLVVIVGIVLRLTHKPDADIVDRAAAADDTPCCGMHLSCEKDSLVAGAFPEGDDYYADEELDAFAGRSADNYSEPEKEMFRDVLLTLHPEEIAPWARALTRRGIALPTDVRDELIMLVTEVRNARSHD